MATLTKRERSIAAKFKRFQKTKARASALYERADRILAEIVLQVEGTKLTAMRAKLIESTKETHLVRIHEDGRQLQLRETVVDDKGIIGWGHGAVRQFDAKVVNAP